MRKMTLHEAEIYGRDCLQKAQVEEALLDTRLLLESVCGVTRNDFLIHPDKILTGEEQGMFCRLLERRCRREPLQYILGRQDFMGLTFDVDERVLIPRVDTEVLVETVEKYLREGMKILDVCTGSGCILLSLLSRNNCTGTGTDISERAIELAKINADKLGVQAAFIRTDFMEGISGTYDVIVSNPPYIPSSVIPTLMEEVRDFEPISALDGGEDGLVFYKRMAEECQSHLKRGGLLALEIGCEQAEAVSLLLQEQGLTEITVVSDYAGLDRVVTAKRP